MRNTTSVRCRLLGVVVAVGMLAAACVSGGGGNGSTRTTSAGGKAGAQVGLVNVSGGQGTPTSGGTLEVSLYSSPPSLDSAAAYGTSSISGIPMAAIYGVLMRYDPKTGTYEPKLAKSLTHNAEFTTWTLTLRPGVTFSDGTPLNAKAVVFQFKRMVKIGKTTTAPIVQEMVTGYDTPDAHTVVFHLAKSWTRFPFVLATDGGMIASPTAVRKEGDQFGRHPVGAGPFTLATYAPQEKIVLTRNPDYWGGKVYLDKIRFTHISGGAATADRFRGGEVQMGVILESKALTSMIQQGVPGYLTFNHGGGWVANENSGHVTDDPRVRQAIAYAMNVKQLNQRAADGKAPYHRTLFPKTSRWDTGTKGLSYNPDKARTLVKQVKKDTGWDGSLHLVAVQTNPAGWQEALTFQGQLEAVGFKVHLRGLQSINQLIRVVFVKKDYDLAYWVITVWDAAPWVALYANLRSDAHRYGYDSKTFDQLLGQLRSAPTQQAGKQVIARMQRLWNTDQPVILNKSSDNYVFWGKKVHGVVPTSLGVVLLDKAFLK